MICLAEYYLAEKANQTSCLEYTPMIDSQVQFISFCYKYIIANPPIYKQSTHDLSVIVQSANSLLGEMKELMGFSGHRKSIFFFLTCNNIPILNVSFFYTLPQVHL